MYGDNLHPELVKRCAEIPIFLAKENEITTKDIDLIWRAGVEKHEAVTHSIYSLLTSLVPNLNLEHVLYLFTSIKDIPLKSYDINTLQLIRTLTYYCLNLAKSEVKEFYGLEIMWDIVQDEVPLSQELKTFAFTFIHDFIPWKFCYNYRLPLIIKSLENLKQHKSSCASFKVLESILTSYIHDQPPTISVQSLIHKLNNDYNILNLFFDDLKHYKTLVNTQIQQNENLKNPEVRNAHLFTKFSHIQEITERLQFLQFILHRSDITLSQDDIDVFWDHIISGSATPEEQELGLKWFEDIERDGRKVFSDEVFLYIFQQKLVKLDTENLSLEGLNLAFSFFKSINIKKGALKKEQRQEFTVTSFDLTGTKFLWEICLSVKKPEVSKLAISLLFSIQKSIAPELISQLGEYRVNFIKYCMDQIVETLSSESLDERKELRILRCLMILTSYTEEFDPRDLPIKRHGSIVRGKPITLRIVVANKQNLNFTLDVSQNETVKSIKETVTAKLELKPGVLKLLTSGKELSNGSRTLDSYGVSNGQVINAISLQRRVKELPQAASFDYSPSFILSNTNNFEQIFKLLSFSDNVSRKAWELLMLLPTNESLLNELLHSESPNWGEILNTNNLYKLLYALQIIESIVDTQGANQDDVDKKNSWGTKFHEQGGVRYLMAIIKSDLYQSSRPKSKTCIALIFQVIVHFIHRLGNDFSSDAPVIIQHILEIVFNSCKSEYPGMEDATIVEHSLELFIFYCYTPEIFKQFLNLPNLSEWLYQSLVLCRNSTIREHIQKAIEHLCEAIPLVEEKPTLSIFFDILESFLPLISTNSNTYTQYFDLYNSTIRSINADETLKQKYSSKADTLVAQLVETLNNHPIIEQNSHYEDSIIIGIMKIIRALLVINDETKKKYGVSLIDQLYSACLFQFPTIENHDQSLLKCKSKQSRLAGFRLLHEVTKNSEENYLLLAKKLVTHHSSFAPNLWNYSPTQLEKSPAGFVGLRNLGATCYMNSLMQQFFMIPKFRKGLLSLPPLNQENLNDDVLYQMQRLFAHLQESQKKFYNTIGFCKAYKDYSGQSVNPLIQMDADEFFNMLFEKLENGLKGTPYESFFKHFFGGKVCNQVISKECDHVSENYEDFYTISVAVKGKNTLEEALDLYVEGDVLEGDNKYQCGKCESKVDALKRGCIADLPNNLIIHMRRFEFDLEEMRRMKVNDHCQFPIQLNMEPYTKAGLEKQEAIKAGKEIPEDPRAASYYQYELVGVLVHTGTADSGHYYSFIKDREKANWFHFNDKEVEFFDEKEIPSRCFGGVEPYTSYDSNQSMPVQQHRQRIDNAYMLFYQRVQQEQTLSDNIGDSCKIPEPIFSSIWKENIQFSIDKYVFDKDYFNFITHFLKSTKFEPELNYDAPFNTESPSFRSIELGTRFLVQTLAHAKERNQLRNIVDILIEKYSSNIPACKWFLSTAIQDNWTRTFLIGCPVVEIREAFANLTSRILSVLAANERNIYNQEVKEEDRDISFYIKQDEREIDDSDNFSLNESAEEEHVKKYIPNFSPKAYTLWFLESIIKELKYLRSSWRNMEQYFVVFKEFTKIGDEEKQYIIKRSIISRFIEFYLGDESGLSNHNNTALVPFTSNTDTNTSTNTSDNSLVAFDNNNNNNNNKARTKMGDKFKSPGLAPMIELIADIVLRVKFGDNPPPNFVEPELSISELDKHFLNQDSFYHRVLSDNINVDRVGDIVAHTSWENKKFSNSIINIISTGLYTDENGFSPYLSILSRLLKVNDSLQNWRMENSMDFLLKVLENCPAMAYFNVIRFLATESNENKVINNWMFSIIENWIAKWLIIHAFDHVRGATEELIQALVYEDPKEKIINEERKSMLFDFLLELLLICPNNSAMQQFMFPMQQPIAEQSFQYQCSPYKLVEYFRLLRWFINSKEYIQRFLEKVDIFLEVFDKVDLRRYEMDENKAQMIRLIDQIFAEDGEYIKIFLERKGFQKRLFEYNISLGNEEPNLSYNNNNLQIAFRVIKRCCIYSPLFLNTFINHKNFAWSFEFLCLAADFNLPGEELFEAVRPLFSDQKFRHRLITLIIHSEKQKIRRFNYKNVAIYFDDLIQTIDDIIYFSRKGGLEFMCNIDQLKNEFEFDAPSLVVVEPALHLLARTTEWLSFDYSESHNLSEMAMDLSQTWDSKMDLFLQLQMYLNNSVIDSVLLPSYKILYNLASSDESLLEIILRHLETEHENYYYSLANPNDISFVSGPKKPCIKAHLPSFSDREKIHQHEDYYLFLRRLCEFTLNRYYNDKMKIQIILNILLFGFIEMIPSPGIHGTFVELLESPYLYPQLTENKFVDHYIFKVVTSEQQILENGDCFNFIRGLFPTVRFIFL